MLERVGSVEASDAFYNLGVLFADQGNLVEAEEMYRRALDGYEKARGPDHPSTLTISNLRLLESKQSEQEGGKETFRQVLDRYEKAADTDKHSQSLPSSARSILIRLKAGVRRRKQEAVNRSFR